MPIEQKIFALVVSSLVFLVCIDLIRKYKLKEEYSVLWLVTSFLMFAIMLKYDWLIALTNFIGAVLPTTTLFIGSIVFLILIAVQFSIKLSLFSNQIKNLAQENALLKNRLETLERSGLEN